MRVYLLLPLLGMVAGLSVPQEDGLIEDPQVKGEAHIKNGGQEERTGRHHHHCHGGYCKRAVKEDELKKSEEMLPKEESMEEERTGRFIKIFKLGKRAVTDDELLPVPELKDQPLMEDQEARKRRCRCPDPPCPCKPIGKRAVGDDDLKKSEEMLPKEESMEEERTGRFIKIFKLGKRAVTDDERLPAPELKDQPLMEDQEARKGRYCVCPDPLNCDCGPYKKRAVGDEDLKKSEEMLPKEESMEEERTGRFIKIFKFGKRAVTEDELLPAPELEEQPLLEGHQEPRKGRCSATTFCDI